MFPDIHQDFLLWQAYFVSAWELQIFGFPTYGADCFMLHVGIAVHLLHIYAKSRLLLFPITPHYAISFHASDALFFCSKFNVFHSLLGLKVVKLLP
jgi:hypothetical protein